jgi:hypothetical protein
MLNSRALILLWLFVGALLGPLASFLLGGLGGSFLEGCRSTHRGALAGYGAIGGIVVGWFLGVGLGAWVGANGANPHRGAALLVAGVVLWMLVGIALPAFWSVQYAATRHRSQNNLRLIGLALHDYSDTHNSLPAGALANEKLVPEQRLSWIVAILPFLEEGEPPQKVYKPVYEAIDQTKSWDAEENRAAARTVLPGLYCTGAPAGRDPNAPGVTEYVGLAGVGVDAPFLPREHKRAGAFGYDRGSRFPHDFEDGTSNTILVAEANWANGPWASGGPATARGFDSSHTPFCGRTGQFGGSTDLTAEVLLGDAAVRTITPHISRATLEAAITMAGGETLGNDW